MSEFLGQTIGKYQIETLIGHGSMADVYLARHVDLGIPVAVKIIHLHLLSQPVFLERFKREAEVMAALRHPHIVRLYEVICQPEMAAIVMEYLPGGTLEARLAQHRSPGEALPLAEVVKWMEALCGAVDFAHRRNLVHRDLKPANILFRETDEPVLTDFGLAFLSDQSRLSHSNSITGTPAYLSPEQARGVSGDERSDIYSLGVILYEMLVGQTPFQGSTISVALKHLSEPPPSPRQWGRYLPTGVEAVLMRALAKNPVERYQSASGLAQALRMAVERAPVSDRADEPAAPQAARAPVRFPAPAASPARVSVGPIRGATSAAVLAPADEFESPQPAFGPRQWAGVFTGVVMLAALVGMIWWGFSLTGSRDAPASAPRFAAGAQIRIVVPDQTSASVLRGCPTGFWLGVVGVATDGQTGQVLGRQGCDGEWWYRITLPQAAGPQWDGEGWISGEYLQPR